MARRPQLACVHPVLAIRVLKAVGDRRRSAGAQGADNDFDRRRFDVPSFAYYGASLPAFVHLATQKGYRLVAIEPRGVNAFFLRNDLAPDLAPLAYQRVPVEGDDAPDFGEGGLLALLDKANLPLVDLH